MVEVVNVVASGSLGIELDLEVVAEEQSQVVEYDPEKYPGAYFDLGESIPLITLYRTGKYIITGAGSKKEATETRETFLELLSDSDIIQERNDEWFSIQNFVCTADLEQDINLNVIAIELGLENTEYEPEQFPGLVYRPPEQDSVMLVFTSGQVVITGSPDLDTAERSFEALKSEIA